MVGTEDWENLVTLFTKGIGMANSYLTKVITCFNTYKTSNGVWWALWFNGVNILMLQRTYTLPRGFQGQSFIIPSKIYC
jgi:hypothetical protein